MTAACEAMFSYAGRELPLFAGAKNFHRYYRDLLGRWIRGHVLEVGGGLGSMTSALLECPIASLTVCEPDPQQAAALEARFAGRARIIAGKLSDVPGTCGPFDTIVYIDVLEHVDDDRAEVSRALGRLTPDGSLLIGGPAHAWLYSPFDAAIGHRRRYGKRDIESLLRGGGPARLVFFAYFDAVGILLSVGNRWFARQTEPSARQIRFWNDIVLPLSRRVDVVLRYRVGKSFVAVASRR